MSLIAIDQSLTRSGWCLIPGSRFVKEEVATNSFASVDCGDFGDKFRSIVAEYRPQFIIFERPLGVIMTYGKKQLTGPGMVTVNADQLHLHRIAGIIDGIALGLGIQRMDIPPASWRARVLGDGRMNREQAKAAARDYCRKIGVEVRNHDQAEAVCLAIYGVTSPEYRYHLSMLKA